MKQLIAIVKVVAFALLYALAGYLGRKTDFVQENYRVLWPQAGVALAGLLVLGLRYWPGVMLGSLIVTLSSRQLEIQRAVVFAICNTASTAAGAWLFLRRNYDRTFGHVRDVYGFLLCGAVVAPLINACLTVPGLAVQETIPREMLYGLWWRRWFGHAISHLIVAPVFMTWSRRWTTRWPRRRMLELVLLVSIFLLVSQWLFTGNSAVANLNYPVSFAPFPFVIWAALRFGPRGSASTTFLVAALAVYGTSLGYGPFSHREAGEGLVLLQVYLLALGLSGLFLAAAVAERRTAMAELRASREQLRALSARIETGREEERARVAREIHDELGQQLTSLKIGIKNLRRRLLESTGCPPELGERFDRLWGLADEAVQAVRRIASDLRPGMLDELGLVEALQWQVRQFQERAGVSATFESNVKKLDLTRELSTAIFRIVQESLTNVARHANATNVQVQLAQRDGLVHIEISDNGVGFAPAGSGEMGSLGIVGMRERARLLGGRLEVSGIVGTEPASAATGTRVTAEFPLRSQEESGTLV